MPIVNRRKLHYGHLDMLQLEFKGKDDIEYRKNVPLSDEEWLSLNIKADGTDPHIYNHKPGGREINKDEPIIVPLEYLYETSLEAGEEWRHKWPMDAGSCVVTAFYPESRLDIQVRNEDDERIIIPTTSVEKIFMAFVDKDLKPLPKENVTDNNE